MKKLSLITSLLWCFSLFAASNVAKVLVFKGKVFVIDAKGERKVLSKRGVWLREGSKLKTTPKSFVRLKFIDKSQMNVGPESEVKIEKFSKDKAGVISVLKGKLRSKVSKDYLNMEEGKSKLFVKSKNAVMGIRGTDFSFMVGKNQAVTAVLYEGSVYFNKYDGKTRDLESVVNRGVSIRPGEFSVMHTGLVKPTLPAKMHVKQFNILKKNSDFKRSPNNTKNLKSKKPKALPPGLKAEKVTNSHSELDKKVEKETKIKTKDSKKEKKDIKTARGFVKDGAIKPMDGSAVDIESGEIVAPKKGSRYDSNINAFENSVDVKEDGNIAQDKPEKRPEFKPNPGVPPQKLKPMSPFVDVPCATGVCTPPDLPPVAPPSLKGRVNISPTNGN